MNWKPICLSATLCTVAFAAQIAIAESEADASSETPVAYVYVASNPKNSTVNVVEAFVAAANGKLSPVPGSPFQADVTSMAVNGKYLFATNRNGIYIDSYWIETNGSLRYAATTDITQSNSGDCAVTGPLFLDHSGASLYDMEFENCGNNSYQSFAVQKATGKLQSKGLAVVGRWLYLPASFIGNDVYAYTASCVGDMYWAIYAFKRSSTGLLQNIDVSTPVPTSKTGDFYCPSLAAADPTDHVAIVMQPVSQEDFSPDGGPQIATYTAESNGSLATTSTNQNMPVTAVGTANDLKMAKSGELLAVAGSSGLEVLHFNGSKPVTHYTGLLTKDPITQMFWDNGNHLYAISQTAGKLHVFTVTPSSHSEAPGSPYTVASPQNIIVQPWPLPWK